MPRYRVELEWKVFDTLRTYYEVEASGGLEAADAAMKLYYQDDHPDWQVGNRASVTGAIELGEISLLPENI